MSQETRNEESMFVTEKERKKKKKKKVFLEFGRKVPRKLGERNKVHGK